MFEEENVAQNHISASHEPATDAKHSVLLVRKMNFVNLPISLIEIPLFMVPTGTGKPGKMEGIFQSGNFDETGKVGKFTQNTAKMRN